MGPVKRGVGKTGREQVKKVEIHLGCQSVVYSCSVWANVDMLTELSSLLS